MKNVPCVLMISKMIHVIFVLEVQKQPDYKNIQRMKNVTVIQDFILMIQAKIVKVEKIQKKKKLIFNILIYKISLIFILLIRMPR